MSELIRPNSEIFLLYPCTLGYEGWDITFPNGVTYTDQVMVQAVTRWLLTAEDHTILGSPCGICGGQNDPGTNSEGFRLFLSV